ncbi:MAG TPA: substrate-binding domain-containing protein, partial [Streptosporangiaceae bacterium]
ALAVRHLLSTGRTRIGHVTGPQRFKAAVLRAEGAQKALASAGLELAGGEPLYGEWTEEWGRQATDVLLRSEADLDAIFCGNDQIARGVADALREAGRRVPDDVALVGFDNWEVIAASSRPPLTTVDMNLRQLGRAAGEGLLAAIDGRPSTGLQLLPCSLVVRESSRSRHLAVPAPAGVPAANEAPVTGGAAGTRVAGGAAGARVPGGVGGAAGVPVSGGASGAAGAPVSGVGGAGGPRDADGAGGFSFGPGD